MIPTAVKPMIYQVRLGAGLGPEDLLDQITRAVWNMVRETRGPALTEDHWPGLRALLQKALASRLVRYARCGEPGFCLSDPKRVFWPSPGKSAPPPVVFLLEVKGGIDRLFRDVSAAVERRFSRYLSLALRERRAWRIDLQRQLTAAMSGSLYASEACAACPARVGSRERRLWSEGW